MSAKAEEQSVRSARLRFRNRRDLTVKAVICPQATNPHFGGSIFSSTNSIS